ncbi:MAG: hypothetical protein AAF491_07170 [Verrucomicrobiota bacterium]
MTTEIDWIDPKQEMPDDMVEVIVALPDGSTDRDHYHDAGWAFSESVVAWAHFPEHDIKHAPVTHKDIVSPDKLWQKPKRLSHLSPAHLLLTRRRRNLSHRTLINDDQ